MITESNDQAFSKAWIVWAFIAAIAVGFVVFILAAPIARTIGYPVFSSAIYKTLSYVCHQIPERSLHLAGHKFGVCSRCTGLYSGLAFATLIYPLTRPLKRTETPPIFWLLLGAAPLAIDFLLGYFSIWPNTHLSRFVTGGLLGAAAVFYIVPGLIELSSRAARLVKRKAQTRPHLRSGL